jgi:butyrate kinase
MNNINDYKVMCINPGSTSTKVALFKGSEKVFSINITHEAADLAEFNDVMDQFEYRCNTILRVLEDHDVNLDDVDAFVGVGGGLECTIGGVYPINNLMADHAQTCYNGVRHPANLGPVLAKAFADQVSKAAFVVNPNDIDEFTDLARLTGVKGIYRVSRGHPLNQKEIARRYAQSLGKQYEDINVIVAHVGGGISIGAHRRGMIVDMTDAVSGDGPMAPTRSGALPVRDTIDCCISDKIGEEEVRLLIQKTGGLVNHLGTSDAREVEAMIAAGNDYAKLVYDAMAYQIAKFIGAMAAVLAGDIDGIVMTGGISHSEYITSAVRKYVGKMAPFIVMPGEFEMEAMAAGAIRVLSGEEEPKTYTGEPPWKGFANQGQGEEE